jgi:hypothetical protein
MQEALEELADRLTAAYPDAPREQLLARLETFADEALDAGAPPKALSRWVRLWVVEFPLLRDEWSSSVEAAIAFQESLRVWVQPAEPEVRFRDRLRKRLGWVVEHYVAAAGLAVAAASALYGLAYARFYGELNTSPGRVGISTSEILANSATGGFALACLLWLMLYLATLPLVPPRETHEVKDERAAWIAFGGFCAMSLACLLALVGLAIQIELPLLWLGVLLGFLFAAFKDGFTINSKSVKPSIAPKPMSFGFDRFLVLAVVIAPIAIVATGVATVLEAGDLGAQARAGEAVRDPKILMMPFLGVRAEPAAITRSDPTLQDSSFPPCALYLGTANNQVILYETGPPAGTIQVPTGDVHIELGQSMSRCKEKTSAAAVGVKLGAAKSRIRRCPAARVLNPRLAKTHPARWPRRAPRKPGAHCGRPRSSVCRLSSVAPNPRACRAAGWRRS